VAHLLGLCIACASAAGASFQPKHVTATQNTTAAAGATEDAIAPQNGTEKP
jgi:hypothetical protein